jgi:hypothetical protein
MNGRSILYTTTEVIDALGGNAKVQVLVEAKSRQRVSNWRRFKSFPSNTHAAMSEALAAIGKTAPRSLWGQIGPENAPRRRPRTKKKRRLARTNDEPREGARTSV